MTSETTKPAKKRRKRRSIAEIEEEKWSRMPKPLKKSQEGILPASVSKK